MCSSRARSVVFIDNPGGSQDALADIGAEALRGAEVDGSADDLCQLALESHHVQQTDTPVGREIDQVIHVAVRPKTVA